MKKVAFRWSSQYFESDDGLPYIGHAFGSPKGNIYVATGFGGNGMTLSHVSALVLRDMLTRYNSNSDIITVRQAPIYLKLI